VGTLLYFLSNFASQADQVKNFPWVHSQLGIYTVYWGIFGVTILEEGLDEGRGDDRDPHGDPYDERYRHDSECNSISETVNSFLNCSALAGVILSTLSMVYHLLVKGKGATSTDTGTGTGTVSKWSGSTSVWWKRAFVSLSAIAAAGGAAALYCFYTTCYMGEILVYHGGNEKWEFAPDFGPFDSAYDPYSPLNYKQIGLGLVMCCFGALMFFCVMVISVNTNAYTKSPPSAMPREKKIADYQE